jgi:vancomycin permeability regulator SanA
MNLTRNGSYYADPDIIKEAQKRYRIKKLKLFLRSGYKKNEQNAIIFELQADLKDMGIDPKALFDVGNLQ